MRIAIPLFFCLGIWLFSTAAFGELFPAYDLETADTLPKGVTSPRFRTIISNTTNTYDSAGQSVPLGATLNRSISWSDVLSAQENEAERASLRSLLYANRAISESEIAGDIKAEINTYSTASVPILLYGLSDSLTLGIAVPIIKVDAQVDTGFTRSASGQEVIGRACAASSPVKCSESAAKLNRAIPHRLETLGYEPLQSRSLTAIGDLRLIGKYSLLRDSAQQLTLKPVVLLPTGRTASPDDVLGLKTGDGRYSLSLSAVFDRHDVLLPHLKFTGYTGYTAFLPDNPEMRIPTLESSLTPDKERVRRGLAHGAFAGVSLKYGILGTGLSLGGGYHFQYVGQSSFDGTRFSAERYARLKDQNPERWLQNTSLLVGFSTIDWYRQKRFSIPLEASVTWNRPVGGRNAWSDDLWAGEFIFYL